MIEPPSLHMRNRGLHGEEHRVTLVLMTDSNVSSVVPPSGVLPAMPALAKTMSSLPNFSDRLLDRGFRRRDVGGVGDERKGVRPQFLRGGLQRLRLRPVMATLAPSFTNSLAVVSPMPLLPPVINAVLFASLTIAS